MKTSASLVGPNKSGFNFGTLPMARRLEGAEAESAVACVAALRRFRPEVGAKFQRLAGGMAVFTGVDSPITQAVGIGLDGPVNETQIKKLEDFYFERGDAARVELCPLADKTVTELFGKRGYRVVEYSNVLVQRLDAIDARDDISKSISIERVGKAKAELWSQTVLRGFSEQLAVTPELLELGRLIAHTRGTEGYLARVDGKPAGGATLVFRKGIAGLSGAAPCRNSAIVACRPRCCTRAWHARKCPAANW